VEEEEEEALQLEEIKVKMEAKGLLEPRQEEGSYGQIQATYGYGNPDSPEGDAERGGEDEETGYEDSGVPEDGTSLSRRRKRRGKASLEDADLEGVDIEDAATVNLLLGRVGAGLENIQGVAIAPSHPGEELAATTPYQVQRAFVAAAEAALRAVEKTEKTKKAQKASYGQDDDSDDDAGAAPAKTPEERALAQLDVIMGRSTAPGAMNMSEMAPVPSVLAAQQSVDQALAAPAASAGGARSPGSPGSPGADGETEQEATRRIAWIKHYIKLGDYDRAIELGWDGDMDFAASLLSPEGGSTPGADSGEQTPISPGEQTPISPEQTPTDSGAQTPLLPDEPPPNVGAGGAEGGGGGGGTKQLCRI